MALSIAIKPGSTYTSIFVSGHGLVLRERTLVAFDGNDKKRIRAVGDDALFMRGTAPNVTVVSPVTDGIITEPEIFTLMLKAFLQKVTEEFFFKPRINAIVGIPLGLSVAERETYEDAINDAGIYSVTLVPNIVLSAIGADLPIGTGRGMLAVNIGGGRTEAALLSHGGIINGCGVSLGGNTLDKALVDYVTGKYNVKIDLCDATKIREQIGSLYANDIANMTVSGMDIVSKVPELVTVYALDFKDVAEPYLKRVCDFVKTIIKACPSAIASDLMTGGIIITGGASKIPGIDKLFMRELMLPVKTFDKPEYIQIIGGGKLLNSSGLLTQLIDGGAV